MPLILGEKLRNFSLKTVYFLKVFTVFLYAKCLFRVVVKTCDYGGMNSFNFLLTTSIL